MKKCLGLLFFIILFLFQGCSSVDKAIDYSLYSGQDIIQLLQEKNIEEIIKKYEDNEYIDKTQLYEAIKEVVDIEVNDGYKLIGSTVFRNNEIENIKYDGVDIHISPFTKIEKELIYNIYSFKFDDEDYLINISYYRDKNNFIPLGFNAGMVTLNGYNGQEYLEEAKKLYEDGNLIPSMKFLITANELSSNIPNIFIGDKDELISYKLDVEKTINLSYSFPARYDFNGSSIVVMGISFGDEISRDLFVVTYNTKLLIDSQKDQVIKEAQSFYNVIEEYYPGLENEEYKIVFRVFDVTGKGEVIEISR
jgi:hypothetical protein